MIVYKFGGGTTRTARGLETLVELVHTAHANEVRRAVRARKSAQKPHGLLVVLSAIGHTTRYLYRAADLSTQGNIKAGLEQLDSVVQKHSQLLQALYLPDGAGTAVANAIRKIATEVRALLEGVAITRELSPRTRDQIASAGERFAIALIEPLLRYRGIPVRYVPARTVIVTDEQFGRATPLLNETSERAHQQILPHLHRAEVVLIDGFVGATRDKITTTMGSESSDLTATLLAAALAASEVVIWKSVAGIFNADPELIPSARLLHSLSFAESEEIGKRGARVLFPTAAEPLIQLPNEIPLRITAPKATTHKSTRAGRSTTILKGLNVHVRLPRPLSLAFEPHLICLQLSARRMDAQRSERASTSQQIARRGKSSQALFEEIQSRILYSVQSGGELLVTLKREMRAELLQTLGNSRWTVTEQPPIAALSLVLRMPESAADTNAAAQSQAIADFRQQMLRALRRFNVIGFFSLERSLVALVEDAHAIQALQKVHYDFFG